MPSRLPVAATAEPLEAFVTGFDDLFTRRNQRQSFRRYLEGLLLSNERNKTLTALANAEPIVGALHPNVQSLQYFLSESNWQAEQVNARRKQLLRECPVTTPTARGALVIDETGDRKDGKKTAHVARQYLANLGKVDNGVVSVTSLYAEEGFYYPLEVEPYTPSGWFEKGKQDTAFRTKPQIALELVQREVKEGLTFRAVVADCFYGENDVFVSGLQGLEKNAGGPIGFVLSLKRSHCWWHLPGEVGSLLEAAQLASRNDATKVGDWQPVVRTFADGHQETWYALEVKTKAYHPEKSMRAVVATNDPALLPEANTWFLMTNLPAPKAQNAQNASPVEQSQSPLPPADLEEVVRLYSLRNWVEQGYKQVKHALGWAQYQVRSDTAMRRHWTLVMCAFSFVWWNHNQNHGQGQEENENLNQSLNQSVSETDPGTDPKTAAEAVSEKKGGECFLIFPGFLRALALGTTADSFLAGPLDTGMASVAGMDTLATTPGTRESVGKPATRKRTLSV